MIFVWLCDLQNNRSISTEIEPDFSSTNVRRYRLNYVLFWLSLHGEVQSLYLFLIQLYRAYSSFDYTSGRNENYSSAFKFRNHSNRERNLCREFIHWSVLQITVNDIIMLRVFAWRPGLLSAHRSPAAGESRPSKTLKNNSLPKQYVLTGQ